MPTIGCEVQRIDVLLVAGEGGFDCFGRDVPDLIESVTVLWD